MQVRKDPGELQLGAPEATMIGHTSSSCCALTYKAEAEMILRSVVSVFSYLGGHLYNHCSVYHILCVNHYNPR